jgi:hypothetical protein
VLFVTVGRVLEQGKASPLFVAILVLGARDQTQQLELGGQKRQMFSPTSMPRGTALQSSGSVVLCIRARSRPVPRDSTICASSPSPSEGQKMAEWKLVGIRCEDWHNVHEGGARKAGKCRGFSVRTSFMRSPKISWTAPNAVRAPRSTSVCSPLQLRSPAPLHTLHL